MEEINERDQIIEKGKRMLREYLNDMGRDKVALNTRKKLFRIIEDEYRNRMTEEQYFENIKSFVTRRKPAAEKKAFCKVMVTELVTKGQIRKKYAEKFPNEYTLPQES